MRTRRSARNQDILFRALGQEGKPASPLVVNRCCFNCCNYPRHGRGRGDCTLLGQVVYGWGVRDCYQGRKEEGK